MAETRSEMAALIDDARALLESLARSDWQDLHIRTAHGEIFIARPGGGSDPILSGQAGGENRLAITAPHVATVAALSPIGSRVEQGEVVGHIAMLDEVIDLTSPRAGIICRHLAEPGQLVGYGTVLLEVAADTER
jgi:biotin carboxyl carrier protein